MTFAHFNSSSRVILFKKNRIISQFPKQSFEVSGVCILHTSYWLIHWGELVKQLCWAPTYGANLWWRKTYHFHVEREEVDSFLPFHVKLKIFVLDMQTLLCASREGKPGKALYNHALNLRDGFSCQEWAKIKKLEPQPAVRQSIFTRPKTSGKAATVASYLMYLWNIKSLSKMARWRRRHFCRLSTRCPEILKINVKSWLQWRALGCPERR